jgi:LPS export ABC transporter protein LptC
MKLMTSGVLAALFCVACNGTTAPPSSDYESLPADQIMLGMTHQMSNGGIRSAHLTADTALMFNDSTSVKLRNVELELFTEQGTVRATLTSEAGEMDQNTNRMIARGSVVLVVKGANGRTVYTEELHYDPNQKQVWSDVQTRMVFPDGRQNTVKSFRSDDQFDNFTAEGLTGSTGIRF